MLHLVSALNGISRGLSPFTIFFIVAGAVQLFWIIALINDGEGFDICRNRRYIILMILYIATRVPNRITNERALTINGIGIATGIFQGLLL